MIGTHNFLMLIRGLGGLGPGLAMWPLGGLCHSLVTTFPLANEETSWVGSDPGRGCVSQDVCFGLLR